MKRISEIVFCALLLVICACGGGKTSKDDLKGRYEIDLSSASDAVEKELSKKNFAGGGMLSMLMSQLDLTVQFEEGKAVFDASAIVSEIVKQFSDKKVELPMALDYKIENDSLYLQYEDKGFKAVGKISKIGDSYDYLKLSSNYKGDDLEVKLKRIK